MNWKKEWKALVLIIAGFGICFYLPVGWARFDNAIMESLHLVKWYAREHVLLCLVPAFFIAGAISVFVSQNSVMKYLGAGANKLLAYGVAAVSGTILAVCSCTVLPLFAGIYNMGAGLGPACAFLYSGPAINVLAIIMTARILGYELGIARAIGAVAFSVVIGVLMHFIFRKEEAEKARMNMAMPETEVERPLWKNAVVMVMMIGVLVFANWAVSGEFVFGVACCPSPKALRVDTKEGFPVKEDQKYLYIKDKGGKLEAVEKSRLRYRERTENPVYMAIHSSRFIIAGLFLAGLAVMLARWFARGELLQWVEATWGFAKQILPLLLAGVLVAGLLLGQPGGEGLIPSSWISRMVGGNSLFANFFASVAGALMYFATLTEIPILQGLISNGMGKGPALALLLAGPALSLPNMLVIRSVMGTKKTIVYVTLVVVMATISGVIFGALF